MKDKILPEKKLSGVCGVFCLSCPVYIGTHENPEKLQYLARQSGYCVKDIECEGCRSEKVSAFCNKCAFKPCAKSKNVDFCPECSDYPCEDIKKFQTQMPHRKDLFETNEIIKKDGFEKWFESQIEQFSCPSCAIINSAYDLTCRNCGDNPSSEFTRKHKTIIEEHKKKLMRNK